VSVGGNLIVNGNLSAVRIQNKYIMNVTTSNYQLIVSEDISLNGRLFVSGNVGIGTTDPTSSLEIQTSSTSTNLYNSGILKVQNKSVEANRSSNILVSVGIGTTTALSTNTAYYGTDIYGSFGFSHGMAGNSHRYSFKNACNFTGTEVLTLLNDGKVGIGKTNPSVALDVNGDFKTSGKNYLGGSTVAMPCVLAAGTKAFTPGGGINDIVSVTIPTGYSEVIFSVSNGDYNANPNTIITPVTLRPDANNSVLCRVILSSFTGAMRINYIVYAIV
jgi:hypothetical protein